MPPRGHCLLQAARATQTQPQLNPGTAVPTAPPGTHQGLGAGMDTPHWHPSSWHIPARAERREAAPEKGDLMAHDALLAIKESQTHT